MLQVPATPPYKLRFTGEPKLPRKRPALENDRQLPLRLPVPSQSHHPFHTRCLDTKEYRRAICDDCVSLDLCKSPPFLMGM